MPAWRSIPLSKGDPPLRCLTFVFFFLFCWGQNYMVVLWRTSLIRQISQEVMLGPPQCRAGPPASVWGSPDGRLRGPEVAVASAQSYEPCFSVKWEGIWDFGFPDMLASTSSIVSASSLRIVGGQVGAVPMICEAPYKRLFSFSLLFSDLLFNVCFRLRKDLGLLIIFLLSRSDGSSNGRRQRGHPLFTLALAGQCVC